MLKKIVALMMTVVVMLPMVSCSKPQDELRDDTLTIQRLQEMCEECAISFFDGFKTRDINAMKAYVYPDYQSSFVNSCNSYFDLQSRKVWLEDFFEMYVEGAQVIGGTFLSDGTNVTLEVSLVLADYTVGNRNWLLLYNTKLYFYYVASSNSVYIANPDAVFDLYDNLCNDYTSHIAAVLLGQSSDDFDASDYYYDEDLGLYISREDLSSVADNPQETPSPTPTPVPEETEPTEEIIEETAGESEVIE